MAARPVAAEQHLITAGERPALTLRLSDTDDLRLAELACYAAGQGRMPLEWHGEAMREFSVRPERPLGSGRSKYNCTAPSRSAPGVYYWYAQLWMGRQADGGWYDE